MLENENRISDASTEGFLRHYLTLFFYLKDILILLINLNYVSDQENIWYTKKWVAKIREFLFPTFIKLRTLISITSCNLQRPAPRTWDIR